MWNFRFTSLFADRYSQYECAAFVIDTWIDSVAQGRSNLAPVKMPWDLIRTLIVETYGGKIDNDGDFNELRNLVKRVLQSEAYEDDHKLVDGKDTEDGSSLAVPGGTSMAGFMDWVNHLPEREPPTYLGLPANAEKLLLIGHGQNMIKNVAKVRDILDEGEQLMAEVETLP